MSKDNTQVGLKKWCEAFIDGDISAGQFKRAVRIWHNKQVEAVLDRLKSMAAYDPSGMSPVINPREVEAERNKLQESEG